MMKLIGLKLVKLCPKNILNWNGAQSPVNNCKLSSYVGGSMYEVRKRSSLVKKSGANNRKSYYLKVIVYMDRSTINGKK